MFIKSNVQSESREHNESHGILDADDDEPLLHTVCLNLGECYAQLFDNYR